MVRTRVGYAGGSKPNPTYRSLGDHSEVIQIEYDPRQITYGELLDLFWRNHHPITQSRSRQYASVIFFHDEKQEELAWQTKRHQEAEQHRTLYTDIVPYTKFWRAEEYHQKYRLRGTKALISEFQRIYPSPDDLVDSTAAARVNGYLGGHGTWTQLEGDIDQLGLSEEGIITLREIVRRRLP